MKNSAAVPSGAAEKRRLRDLTKLMLIIFARYIASLTVYVASSQSAPLTHSLPFIRLFSFPIYLAQLPLGLVLTRSLPLSQPSGLPVYLAQFPLARFIEWQLREFVAHRGFHS